VLVYIKKKGSSILLWGLVFSALVELPASFPEFELHEMTVAWINAVGLASVSRKYGSWNCFPLKTLLNQV